MTGYVEMMSPVDIELDGRISVVNGTNSTMGGSGNGAGGTSEAGRVTVGGLMVLAAAGWFVLSL